jgi:hypothetical protein
VNRDIFDRLVAVLADNPLFVSKGTKPQAHVKVQLACFLLRYGTRGSDIYHVAHNTNVGDGSVINHCKRVSRATRELRPRFLKWPDDDRQVAIADDIEAKSGLRLCIGSGDGSHVHQTAEPHELGYMYRNRKHAFSVRVTNCLIMYWLIECL